MRVLGTHRCGKSIQTRHTLEEMHVSLSRLPTSNTNEMGCIPALDCCSYSATCPFLSSCILQEHE